MRSLKPLVAVFLLAAFPAHAARKPKPPQVAAGEMTVDGAPAEAGQKIRWGQTIATGGAPADVRLPGFAAFRMSPKTVLRLALSKTGGVRVLLEKGGVLSAVKKGAQYQVRTPLAVAAVRGTVFQVQMEKDEKTYSCLCEGKYSLTVGKKPPREVSSKGHTASLLSKEDEREAGLLHHDDADVAAVKALLK